MNGNSGDASGERRQATILFSDLSGYTAMSERLDPEEVLDITHRILGEAARIVHGYGGRVEKLMGDALLAVFGAPHAHDDDPARAVRAALDIAAAADAVGAELEPALGTRLSMHAGVSTGLVITGAHDPSSGRESLVGDAVNVASRLTSVAGAGQVVVSAETYRHAAAQIEFEGLGPVSVKGKAGPLEVYRAIAPLERAHRSEVGSSSVLVGRDGELRVLTDALERARRGERVFVAVRGDPGTGKSRLVSELRALVAGEARWFEGASDEWESGTPHRLFADMFLRACNVGRADDPALVRARVNELVDTALGPQPVTEAYLCALLGVDHEALPPSDPLAWSEGVRKAIRDTLDGYCRAQPTVLCFEDLHWADASSLDLTEDLLGADAPALLVLCYRSGFELFAKHPEILGLDLRELPGDDAGKLAESMLVGRAGAGVGAGSGRVSDSLVAYLAERTGGNPLFVGETVEALLDAGALERSSEGWVLARAAAAQDVPSTLSGVVLARVDRLDPSARALLQQAAVLGQRFSRELLDLVAAERPYAERPSPERPSANQPSAAACLRALAEAGLLIEDAEAPGDRMAFKHALVHAAVYESLLRRDRVERHRAVVRRVEECWPERAQDMCETLAFHADRGELAEEAIGYLALSGERAVERYGLREAKSFYERAIEIAESAGDGPANRQRALHLLLDEMYVYDFLGDFSGLERALDAHQDLVDEVNDPGGAALFWGFLGFAVTQQERHREAASIVASARGIAVRSGDQRIVGQIAAWQALAASQAGDLDLAITCAEEALALVEDAGRGRYVHLIALNALVAAYFFRGDAAKQEAVGDALIQDGRRGDLRREVCGRISIGMAAECAGNHALAASRFRDALEVAVEPFFAEYAEFMLGISLVLGGEMEDAEEVLKHVIEFSSEHGTRTFGLTSEALSGLRAFATGDLATGVALTQGAARNAVESASGYREAMHNCSLGRVFLQLVLRSEKPSWSFLRRNAVFLLRNAPSAAKKCERHLRRSIEVAERIGAVGVSGQAHQLLGRLYAATRKPAQARVAFETAIERFEECSAYQYLAETRGELAAIGAV